MNGIFTFARRAATVLVLAALGAAALSSCKPEKKDPTPLTTPQPSLAANSVNSLTFSWSAVQNAVQYSYELAGPDGSRVDGGTTSGLSAEFTGLEDNTTYTFKITAYPEVNSEDYLSSSTGQCTGTTGAIMPLKTPVLSVEQGEGTVTISWEAIENAASYVYSFVEDGGAAGKTTETSVSFRLDPGKYTFTLYAVSGNEAYSDSEKASTEFEVEQVERRESWTVTGTVDDGAGKKWDATLVAWNDGTYTLKDWYGTAGYDLEFYVNSDATITVTNKTTTDGYDYVQASADEWISIDTNYYEGYGAYSEFSGNSSKGEVWFWSWKTEGYFDFVWPATGGGSQEEKTKSWSVTGTVDDGAGNNWEATMVAWSDGSYTIKNWYNTAGYDIDFTVNSDATITVTNATNGYVLANADKWIGIDTKYYEGYGTYSEFKGDKSAGEVWFWSYETNGYYDFTWPATGGDSGKKESWSATGTVDDGAGKKWEATLTAWEDGSYTIKSWYGTEGYDLDFTVNENKTITVSNVTVSEGYNYVLAGADKWICIDTNYYEGYGSYSEFSGNKDAGEVWFWSYETNGYYDFVWPATGGDQGGESVTVDQLVGTYTQNNTYQFWYNGAWGNYSSDNDVTIAKVDDKTISISGFMYAESDGGKTINATVDNEKRIIIIEPQMVDSYYTLAGKDAITNSVTVTYNNGTLYFGNWCLWYNGSAWAYSTKTTLTKK